MPRKDSGRRRPLRKKWPTVATLIPFTETHRMLQHVYKNVRMHQRKAKIKLRLKHRSPSHCYKIFGCASGGGDASDDSQVPCGAARCVECNLDEESGRALATRQGNILCATVTTAFRAAHTFSRPHVCHVELQSGVGQKIFQQHAMLTG